MSPDGYHLCLRTYTAEEGSQKPDMVAKAVPIVIEFVTKSSGADVGKLLAGVVK